MFIGMNGTTRVVRKVFTHVAIGGLLSQLLSGDFFCCEETTAGTTGTTHGVLVAGLVEIRLGRKG